MLVTQNQWRKRKWREVEYTLWKSEDEKIDVMCSELLKTGIITKTLERKEPNYDKFSTFPVRPKYDQQTLYTEFILQTSYKESILQTSYTESILQTSYTESILQTS